MVEPGAVHPPAYAATLIVSLGLLSVPQSVATIVASVVILVGTHQVADAILTEMYGDDSVDMGAGS